MVTAIGRIRRAIKMSDRHYQMSNFVNLLEIDLFHENDKFNGQQEII